MAYNHRRRGGGGFGDTRSSSSPDRNYSSSSNNSISLLSNLNSDSNNNTQRQYNHNQKQLDSDPVQSWWESVSKARTRIQTLISLLPPSDEAEFLSSLSDSDTPARSLLDSFAAYTAISGSITGSGDDPLCQWLYDTFQDDDSELRLVVMSLIPLLAGLYLTRIHELSTTTPAPDSPSLAGFEAVLLALYSSQTKSRAGKPILVSFPTPGYLASHSSLYHYVPTPVSKSPPTHSESAEIGVGVVCPPLEPQVGIKSTKRACIIGVAFHSFYIHISHMPAWSKIEVCRFAATWAGNPRTGSPDECEDDENVVNDEAGDGEGRRIPLSWEVLQPMLRILGHCLMGPPPIVSEDIKEAAAVAVRRLYARASHDLCPQAILATRALVQLHARANAAAAAAALLADAASTVTTPTSVKKSPEMLLLSQ